MSKRNKYLENQEKKRNFLKQILESGKTPIPKSYLEPLLDKIIIDIGRDIVGTHKYNVWLAREAKKNFGLIDGIIENPRNFEMIVDWLEKTKKDILQYSFEEALEAQKKWHTRHFQEINERIEAMINAGSNEKIDRSLVISPSIDLNRIIFRCSDEKHFFYLLKSKDLTYEGSMMGHCVGGERYKKRLNNQEIIIISLRDNKNKPHVTIEINTKTRRLIQKSGKSNKPIKEKYKNLITEFILYKTGYEKIRNKEKINQLNANFF